MKFISAVIGQLALTSAQQWCPPRPFHCLATQKINNKLHFPPTFLNCKLLDNVLKINRWSLPLSLDTLSLSLLSLVDNPALQGYLSIRLNASIVSQPKEPIFQPDNLIVYLGGKRGCDATLLLQNARLSILST